MALCGSRFAVGMPHAKHQSRFVHDPRHDKQRTKFITTTLNMSSELEQHSPSRTHSIDLSMQLERELDNEASPPVSPTGDTNRPQSLDSSVLASIVTQLRFSLDEVTKERDGLVQLLDESTRKQADLQDNLHIVTERSSTLEVQLSAAQDKHREDEEAISMLRAKVEESRFVS